MSDLMSDYDRVPFCSLCGASVGDERHPGDDGVGPYCPGCGVRDLHADGCLFGDLVAILPSRPAMAEAGSGSKDVEPNVAKPDLSS